MVTDEMIEMIKKAMEMWEKFQKINEIRLKENKQEINPAYFVDRCASLIHNQQCR